jgi:hypothetical protein
MMMKKRIENPESGEFYKLLMNSFYCSLIKNQEKYTNSTIVGRKKAEIKKRSDHFQDMRELNNEMYQVESVPSSFGCDTDIVNGFLTLDNSKFIYLSFIYHFLYKCMDMERIHYAEGDTDSLFLSVAGNPEEDYHQAFKHVILNEKFYNKNVYNWLPNSFYSTNNSAQVFKNKMKEKIF